MANSLIIVFSFYYNLVTSQLATNYEIEVNKPLVLVEVINGLGTLINSVN